MALVYITNHENMRKSNLIIISLVWTMALSSCFFDKKEEVKQDTNSTQEQTNSWDTNLTDNNITETMANNDYQTAKPKAWDIVAVMKTTNGTMKIKLFPNEAPLAVTNFIGLAKKGYYNNLIFHRIIKDFMLQGWDPTGTGMWGESIYGKEFEDEFSSKLHNIKWALSMANSGPKTNGSQFFIVQAKSTSWLDWAHTVFGQVYEGIDNVDKIAGLKTDSSDKPVKEIKIISLDIMEYSSAGLKEYKFDLDSELKKIEWLKWKKAEDNKNRQVKAWDQIAVHYNGKLEDGTKFDSSYDRGTPLEFKVWAGKMIKWFDAWVVWMKVWEKKTIEIEASDWYGEINKELVKDLDLSEFKTAGIEPKAGLEIQTGMWKAKIISVSKDKVKVDFNHFLAGKKLIFDVELVQFKN